MEQEIIAALEALKEEIDVCEYLDDWQYMGVGYNELRYFRVEEIDGKKTVVAESNNVHALDENGEEYEDEYETFCWEEMTDAEKEEIYRIFCKK